MLSRKRGRRFESFRLRLREQRRAAADKSANGDALVVQWIGRELAELEIGVRLLSGAQQSYTLRELFLKGTDRLRFAPAGRSGEAEFPPHPPSAAPSREAKIFSPPIQLRIPYIGLYLHIEE